jgi:hypothetical protein
MQESNWRQIMTAYHDKNFSVIPLTANRKPMPTEWSKYNHSLPDEPLYDVNQRGIGILPGPESGVMFVDIDTDDEIILNRLKQILPTSPVQRFGSKGKAIAYAYNEALSSKVAFKHIKVEVFMSSGCVTLPPSRHPDTGKDYIWLTDHTLLNFPKEMLPTFGQSTLDELEEFDLAYARANPPESFGEIKSGGRHDTLLAQAFAGLHKGKTLEVLAHELVNYDKGFKKSWFIEDCGALTENEILNSARKFVDSALKTFEKKNGIKEMKKEKKLSFKYKDYPKPKGFMSDLIDFLNRVAVEEQNESSFASTLAMMSYLCACRFTCGGQFSNICVINLAETGAGKSSAMKKVIPILDGAMKDRFHLRTEYRSEPSVWAMLTEYKDVFDALEEISGLFKKAADKNQNYGELLMKLWDSSDTKWKTPEYGKSNKDAGSIPKYIRNPSMTIWGAATIQTFESIIDASTYENGLLPRTLLLIKEGHGAVKEEYIPRSMIKEGLKIFENSVKTYLEQVPIRFIEKNSAVLSEAEKEIETIELLSDELGRVMHKHEVIMRKRMHKTKEPALKGFMSRQPQHALKLAMLHCISRNFDKPLSAKIEQVDIDWANEMFEVMIHNNALFFSRTATKNEVHKKNEKVYAFIASKENGSSRSELLRHMNMLGATLKLILQDLIDSGRIASVRDTSNKPGPSAERFFAIQRDED